MNTQKSRRFGPFPRALCRPMVIFGVSGALMVAMEQSKRLLGGDIPGEATLIVSEVDEVDDTEVAAPSVVRGSISGKVRPQDGGSWEKHESPWDPEFRKLSLQLRSSSGGSSSILAGLREMMHDSGSAANVGDFATFYGAGGDLRSVGSTGNTRDLYVGAELPGVAATPVPAFRVHSAHTLPGASTFAAAPSHYLGAGASSSTWIVPDVLTANSSSSSSVSVAWNSAVVPGASGGPGFTVPSSVPISNNFTTFSNATSPGVGLVSARFQVPAAIAASVPVAVVPTNASPAAVVAPPISSATLLLGSTSSGVSSSGVVTMTASLAPAPPAGSVNIGYQYVPIGNPGNANDSGSGKNFGQVNYSYNIGKYDVTLSQYATFLNAVAQSDGYGLYNLSMAPVGQVPGISRSGNSGTWSYAVSGDGNRPITYVSWFDAARFANWMQNSEPTGLGESAASTEEGAYTLDGKLSGIVTKNATATVWIPTESEWYKAAYYDPTLNGGAGGYWSYATQSNTAPGNTVGSLPNQANYITNGTTSGNAITGYLTDVGAFSMSLSAYGTYDQSGDVNNWNDAIVASSERGYRGGAWDSGSSNFLQSSNGEDVIPSFDSGDLGFRLVSIPEPSSWVSLAGGVALLLGWRRRRRAS